MVMEVVEEDMGDGSMICREHPYKKSSSPGGICALCLQEKLGKLVSSSFPSSIFPSSSPSPSPSPSATVPPNTLFTIFPDNNASLHHGGVEKNIVFQRSRSTAISGFAPDDYTPRRRGFWKFLYLNSQKSRSISMGPSSFRQRSIREMDEEEAVDRKVSRSRSVGCGSRSFSGDFFERISTGFGDCTLRRVESQREGGKPKTTPIHHRQQHTGGGAGDIIKERVRCGGLFSGFMVAVASSSSSSSSSSSYWDGRGAAQSMVGSHGRSKSWGWAFASPMRAFSKPKSKSSSNKSNATPNLNAIPSLLAVGG